MKSRGHSEIITSTAILTTVFVDKLTEYISYNFNTAKGTAGSCVMSARYCTVTLLFFFYQPLMPHNVHG